MKMHKHDQDIIMALAEGSLDHDSAEQAAIAVSACQECSTDLELQKRALAALQDAPRVYLTATESARLHDRLRQELRLGPAELARAKPVPAWSRWAALAAGTAAVLLAAFLVLPNLLGGGDDSAETVAFDQGTDDASGDTDMERAATTAAAAEAPTAGGVPETDRGMMALEDTTNVTTAAPETTAAPAGDGATFASRFEEGLTEELRLQIVDWLIADTSYFMLDDEEIQELQPAWAECLAVLSVEGVPPGYTQRLIESTTDENGVERLLVAIFDDEDPTSAVLASITLPECEVYETLP
jgi:hypothetical protein